MSLEIADYEKTIKSLNLQIISKDKEANKTMEELTNLTKIFNVLNEDFQSLKKENENVNEKNKKLKQLLIRTKKDVLDAKANEAEHLSADVSMKTQIDSQNLEIANYKVVTKRLFNDK